MGRACSTGVWGRKGNRRVWWTGSTDCGVGRGGVAGVGDSSGAVDLAPRRAPGKLRKR